MQKHSTIDPKILYYNSNGSGRDSYITVNSGGICTQRPHTAFTTERKDLKFGDFTKKTQINIIPKTIHYNSDGTGRDQYIGIDEGGLTMNGKGKYSFINALRNYNGDQKTTPVHLQKDFFLDCQKFLPKLEVAKNKKIQKSQKSSSWRLSQPRLYPDPYEGVFYRPKTSSKIRAESHYRSINFY